LELDWDLVDFPLPLHLSSTLAALFLLVSSFSLLLFFASSLLSLPNSFDILPRVHRSGLSLQAVQSRLHGIDKVPLSLRNRAASPTMFDQAAFSAMVTKPLPGESHCTWPIPVIAHSRDLDLTQCFEHAVVLPVPLVISILLGTAQIFSVARRLKLGPSQGGIAWITRNTAGERVGRIKVVSVPFIAGVPRISV
jgi:hypothetical protein